MSKENPFADPREVNPFADPYVKSQNKPYASGLGDYNPFAEQQPQSKPVVQNTQAPVYAPQPTYSTTPATLEPTRAESKPFYGGYGGEDAIRQRQEELERKAQELQRKEDELKNLQRVVEKQSNFPPLPKFCCVQPCFYHDISVDIPISSQRSCRMLFYIWQLYVFVLFYNTICSLALLVTGGDSGATTFGVSLLYLVLFTPCSFLLWYRPVYKALRSDSSFNYMLFFFMFFFQICFTCIYALGIPAFGTCGWINAAKEIDLNNEGVAVMMFICAALWTILAIFQILLLKKVHQTYRASGASLQKAQGELARDVMSNKNVQNAAADAIRTSVQGGQY